MTYLSVSYSSGCEASDFRPGDFILTHRNTLLAKLIRFGEKLRLRKSERKFSFWNHAAIIVDEKGNLIEALAGGITKRNISVYKDVEYTLVRIPHVLNVERANAVKFAKWSLGEGYGYLTFINVALWCLFGGRFSFGLDGQEICSGLVARCMERFGEIFPRDPSHMMPSDLAMHFNVSIPGGFK